jgi:hypothetical protein
MSLSSTQSRFNKIIKDNQGQWYFLDDDLQWQVSSFSKEIELLRYSYYKLTINNYNFDLVIMKQRNNSTGKERDMKREITKVETFQVDHFQPIPDWITKYIVNQSFAFYQHQDSYDFKTKENLKLDMLDFINETCMSEEGRKQFELRSFEPIANPALAARFLFHNNWIRTKRKFQNGNPKSILFHGTSLTDPKTVCENGLKLSHAADNSMKGKGLYFSSDPLFGCYPKYGYFFAHRKTNLDGSVSFYVLVCAVTLGQIATDHSGDSLRYSWSGLNTYSDDCFVVYHEDQLILGILEIVERKEKEEKKSFLFAPTSTHSSTTSSQLNVNIKTIPIATFDFDSYYPSVLSSVANCTAPLNCNSSTNQNEENNKNDDEENNTDLISNTVNSYTSFDYLEKQYQKKLKKQLRKEARKNTFLVTVTVTGPAYRSSKIPLQKKHVTRSKTFTNFRPISKHQANFKQQKHQRSKSNNNNSRKK